MGGTECVICSIDGAGAMAAAVAACLKLDDVIRFADSDARRHCRHRRNRGGIRGGEEV